MMKKIIMRSIVKSKLILSRLKKPHFSWPPIDVGVKRAVMKQLNKSISIYDRSGIFKEFEDLFAKMHNRKFALLCSSGTMAIHTMYVVAGLKKGDEVICPAYTFFATVSPLLFTGATPVLCDCADDGNIDPEEIRKKITPRTKALVVTHMWGLPCKMEEISMICKDNNLLLLEDCSHGHGAGINGNLVGSFGHISAWSLQGAKNVSGGEGGIMTTDNAEYYYKALLLGHYNKRCRQEIPKDHPLAKFAVTGMGLKYRAHPLAISIAYEILKKLKNYLSVKDTYAKMMMDELNSNILKKPEYPKGVQPSWYSLIFQYNQTVVGGKSVTEFYEAIKAEGLTEVDRPTSTAPLNLLPLFQTPEELFPEYKGVFSYKKGDFPKAEMFYDHAIKLPVWAKKEDFKIVTAYIDGIKRVVDRMR